MKDQKITSPRKAVNAIDENLFRTDDGYEFVTIHAPEGDKVIVFFRGEEYEIYPFRKKSLTYISYGGKTISTVTPTYAKQNAECYCNWFQEMTKKAITNFSK